MSLTPRGRSLVIALILLASLLVGAFGPWDSMPWNQGVVYEDSAQWDCATMGNRICGDTL
jgi:hypothetical protein